MKIKDSERNLLILLGVIVVIFIYSTYIYLPMDREKKELATEIETLNNDIQAEEIALSELQVEYETIMEKIDEYNSINDNDDTDVIPTNYNLSNWKDRFFADISEDEIIMLIERFVPIESYLNEPLYIGSTSFSMEEEIISMNYSMGMIMSEENSKAYHNNVTVDVVGKLGSVEKFVENITTYKYPIFIKKFLMEPYDEINQKPIIDYTNDNPYGDYSVEYLENGFDFHTKNEDFVKATLVLDFLEVPILKEYNTDNNIYFVDDEEKITSNPFAPFTDFYEPVIYEDGEVEEQIVDKYRFEPLYGFENVDYFFVGKPNEEVRGNTKVTNKALEGNYALALNYNFVKSQNENIAYTVAGANKAIVSDEVLGLLINMYTDDIVPHTIGVVLKDNRGVETEIDFTTGLSKGWQELPILLPDTIRYPFTVERFYVKDNGEKTYLNGTVIFDSLISVYHTEEYKAEQKLEENIDRGKAFENQGGN